ncbi:MAG: hypothetical protein AAF927_34105 [Bacteroidota bacterium]
MPEIRGHEYYPVSFGLALLRRTLVSKDPCSMNSPWLIHSAGMTYGGFSCLWQ